MGLRFRKSISIIPGVKLNFGKKGMSVSTGVPGFRKAFHTSGRVTTSVDSPEQEYLMLLRKTKTEHLATKDKREMRLQLIMKLYPNRLRCLNITSLKIIMKHLLSQHLEQSQKLLQ